MTNIPNRDAEHPEWRLGQIRVWPMRSAGAPPTLRRWTGVSSAFYRCACGERSKFVDYA